MPRPNEPKGRAARRALGVSHDHAAAKRTQGTRRPPRARVSHDHAAAKRTQGTRRAAGSSGCANEPRAAPRVGWADAKSERTQRTPSLFLGSELMKTFNLPDLGEGLQEAEIVDWHVGPGDQVVADQPLVSVETDKAVVEVPSPRAGRIAELFGAAGDIVKVGGAAGRLRRGRGRRHRHGGRRARDLRRARRGGDHGRARRAGGRGQGHACGPGAGAAHRRRSGVDQPVRPGRCDHRGRRRAGRGRPARGGPARAVARRAPRHGDAHGPCPRRGRAGHGQRRRRRRCLARAATSPSVWCARSPPAARPSPPSTSGSIPRATGAGCTPRSISASRSTPGMGCSCRCCGTSPIAIRPTCAGHRPDARGHPGTKNPARGAARRDHHAVQLRHVVGALRRARGGAAPGRDPEHRAIAPRRWRSTAGPRSTRSCPCR